MPVLFRDTGRSMLRVALIYGDSTAAPAPRYFLGTSAFDANFTLHYDSRSWCRRRRRSAPPPR